LTSARWDCHYPAPAKTQLIASCSHEGSLDVYSLPLDGAVPREWTDARLVAEIGAARDLWTRLLLAARRLSLAKTPADQEPIIIEMLAWHLALGEYESTIYNAEQRLTSPDAQAFGAMVSALARHRRTDLALIHGETSEQYVESERARAERLRPPPPGSHPRLSQLRSLVISEIDDDIGEKAAALASFRELDVTQLADPWLAPLVASRAERLYRLHADRTQLLDVYAKLAGLTQLGLPAQLEYAQRYVSELTRGGSAEERGGALAEARQHVADGSELALLLDVELALLPLDDATQEDVRKQLFALYTKNKDPDRRRALVLSTLRAAAKRGNEYLQYQFVTSWASSVSRERPERKYAEELYNDIVLDRAYGEGRQGKLGESRGYFFGATVATDSLEAHIGYIEARLAEGGPKAQSDIDEAYKQRFASDPEHPVYRFVRAYRLARELPRQTNPERHEADVAQCITWLAAIADVLPKQPQIHQLWGFVLHQHARRAGARQAAVDANRQYLLALDLARGDERLTASLLHRLGILQASMGNHALAMRYLKQRDQYPHIRPREELSLRATLAQSAWHAGEPGLARDQMRAAQQLIAAKPELQRYRALVSDRLGLALTATGEAAEASHQYQALPPLLAAEPERTPLNELKARVGLAANALRSRQPKVALSALSKADEILAEHSALETTPDVVWRRSLITDYRYTPLQYRALVAGLRAQAARELGDNQGALAATERRVDLLGQRLAESEADEDRLELAQAQLHLAQLHYRLQQLPAAGRALEAGLALSDTYNTNTGSEVNDAQLALIQAYAELALYGHVPAAERKRDLYGELQRVYGVLCKYRNPRLFKQRFLFEVYLSELALDPGR
ncbi:MAG: hypothetical protein ABW321_16695, partial [Polyangiales bacterium]